MFTVILQTSGIKLGYSQFTHFGWIFQNNGFKLTSSNYFSIPLHLCRSLSKRTTPNSQICPIRRRMFGTHCIIFKMVKVLTPTTSPDQAYDFPWPRVYLWSFTVFTFRFVLFLCTHLSIRIFTVLCIRRYRHLSFFSIFFILIQSGSFAGHAKIVLTNAQMAPLFQVLVCMYTRDGTFEIFFRTANTPNKYPAQHINLILKDHLNRLQNQSLFYLNFSFCYSIV